MRSTDTPSGYKRVKEYPDGGWLFVLDDGTGGGNGHAKGNGKVAPAKQPKTYPTADAAVASFVGWSGHQGGTLTRTPYSDSFESLRLDYPDERGKDIMPLSRRGDGAWWFKRPTGVLPLCPAYWRDDTTVIVTEGEKDMHALGALGQCVTTSAFGSKAATKSDWSPLADRDVIVWPDNDEPGERYLADVARLVGHPIRVFRPSGAGDAHGATDWIARQTDEGLADVEAIIENQAEPYTPPEREPDQQDQPGTFHRTDTGNAERFVSQHGRDLHFRSSRTGNYEGGAWFVWQGTHWALDETLMVPGLVKATVREMYAEAATIEAPEKRQALVDYAKGCESKHRRAAMLSLAKSESGIAIKPTAFDTDVWQFNCTNGTLDLRTGKMRSHNRADLITRQAPVAFDPDATCPRWDRFLLEIMDTNRDLIEFLQRLCGYLLTGDIREQILPIFYGAGANGKSVFIDTLKGLMGAYASDAPPGLLTAKKHDEHPTEIADLQGRRFIVSSETEEGRRLNAPLVKRLTGDSTLKGRFMREDFFEFQRTFTCVLVTNNRPRIVEDKLAIWRRIKLVPFEVVIPPTEQDPTLLATLRGEWAGVLRWAVEGCQLWQTEGLCVPSEVEQATDHYRAEQDILAAFVEDRLEEHPVAKVSRKELFATYTKWAQDNNEKYPLKRADLYERMKQRDYEPGSWRDGKSVVRGFVGVGLRISQG